MGKKTEDNTVAVVQRAVKEFGIRVTMGSVKQALTSHPQYPTFKSICDVLEEWKIEHYPLKYEPGELMEIPTPYIAHFKAGGGRIVFVKNISDHGVTFYESHNKKKQLELNEFTEKSSGAVILLNPDKESGEKDYKSKRHNEIITWLILPAIILTAVFFIVVLSFNALLEGAKTTGITPFILLFTNLTGIGLSILLVLHEYEIRLSLTDKLCHLNNSTNCNTVLNDKASKIFGWIGWSDVGLIYFTGSLLLLLYCTYSSDFSLPAVLSVMSAPYPVFSIYYQGIVLKKWCPLCLGVQLLLIAEFIILFPALGNLVFSFKDLAFFVLTFLTTTLVYLSFTLYKREKSLAETNFSKYLGFKKNPEVLKALISGQKQYHIPITETSLVFGDTESQFIITAFMSLNCSHCADAFIKIKEAIASGVKCVFNIILVTGDKAVLNTLYHLNKTGRQEEAISVLDQWYGLDTFSRNKIHDDLCIPDVEDVSDDVNNENSRLFRECNVPGTPTFFVNGYRLPNQYSIEDIKYYSEVFSEKQAVEV
jgi:uncharacterized membrane protein